MKRLGLLLCVAVLWGQVSADWSMKSVTIPTEWASQVTTDCVLPEYPRPQMVRSEWQNLNGLWSYATMSDVEDDVPTTMSKEILVPFCVEAPLSGIGSYSAQFAYRRTFSVDDGWLEDGKRVLLHFGAVDWQAIVLVNGTEVGRHQGGYTAFSFDITDYLLTDGSEQTLEVKVYDPTNNAGYPRGKQSLSSGNILYTTCSGIWQTVWLESVPEVYISDLSLVPDIDAGTLSVEVEIGGEESAAQSFTAVALKDGQEVASVTAEPGTTAVLSISNAELWSPDSPNLYDLQVSLQTSDGAVDEVESYFGMRKIEIRTDDDGYTRMYLNNEFLFHIGPLDQGYWPDGIYTAPTDEALASDIVMMKRMGFNAVRKHLKVEPLRWYYYCDKLGLMVWQDMPSANSYTSTSISVDQDEFLAELSEMMDELKNVPSIVMWVLFNESQGQVGRTFTRTAYSQAAAQDDTRLINDASGGTHYSVGDVRDYHFYPSPGAPSISEDIALVNGEYGGIGLKVSNHTWSSSSWSYMFVDNSTQLAENYDLYARSLATYRQNKGLSGAIYTQLTDVEKEHNGLLTYDRYPKPDIQAIYKSNRTAIEGYVEQEATYVLPTADVAQTDWLYTTETPGDGWYLTSYDDSSWSVGQNGFGANGLSNMTYGTSWTTSDIYLRKTLDLNITDDELESLKLKIYNDEDCEVYFNGTLVYSDDDYLTGYSIVTLGSGYLQRLDPQGSNVIAVHCAQSSGGQYIDVGLYIPIASEDEADRSIDFTLDYPNSSQISVSIGYALDTLATEPEALLTYSTFPFAETEKHTADYSLTGTDNALLGGQALSYNLYSLTHGVSHTVPVKYFVNFTTTGSEEGSVSGCTYCDNTAGTSALFTLNEATIAPNATTTLTYIANVDPVSPPRNLRISDEYELTWDEPAGTSLQPTAYNVYADDSLRATLATTETTYSISVDAGETAYAVSALYDQLESDLTETVSLNTQDLEDSLLSDAAGCSLTLLSSYYAGQAVEPSYELGSEVVAALWSVPELGLSQEELGSPSFVFTSAGSYPITLRAYTSEGYAELTATATIVSPSAPVAAFSLPADTIRAGEQVVFVNQSEGSGNTYTWTFLSTEGVDTVCATNPTLSFSYAGTYVATLVASNAAGTSRKIKAFTVTGPLSEAQFSVSPRAVLAGEPVYLETETDEGLWTITSGSPAYISGGNTSFTPTHTGLYTITRDEGDYSSSLAGAFACCTAFSYYGLLLTPSNPSLTLPSPFTEAISAFSIDWWMCPSEEAPEFVMQTSDGQVIIEVATDGTLEATVGSRTLTSDAAAITPAEWHHYTLIYGSVRLALFRDGEQIARLVATLPQVSAWSDFQLSLTGTTGNVQVDELSFWNTRFSPDSIAAWANIPLVDDTDNPEGDDLTAYYSFNDTTLYPGLTCLSIGPFALTDTTDVETFTDVTSYYLTNYSAPFLMTGRSLSQDVSLRFYELLTGMTQSTWEGDIWILEGGEGIYVDAALDECFTARTAWNPSLPDEFTGSEVYQEVTLPAGKYRFALQADSLLAADNCYLFAEQDGTTTLAPIDEYLDLLLIDENTITLGLNYTLPAYGCLSISEFSLLGSSATVGTATGETLPTGISSADTGDEDARSVHTSLTYDLQGRPVSKPSRGIYIRNGRKVIID